MKVDISRLEEKSEWGRTIRSDSEGFLDLGDLGCVPALNKDYLIRFIYNPKEDVYKVDFYLKKTKRK